MASLVTFDTMDYYDFLFLYWLMHVMQRFKETCAPLLIINYHKPTLLKLGEGSGSLVLITGMLLLMY